MSWNYTDFQKWIAEGCRKDIAEIVHTIDLSDNRLTTLPDSLSLFTNLRELNLSENRLTSLARPQSGLTSLPNSISTKIDTSHRNQLPPCLGNDFVHYFPYLGNILIISRK